MARYGVVVALLAAPLFGCSQLTQISAGPAASFDGGRGAAWGGGAAAETVLGVTSPGGTFTGVGAGARSVVTHRAIEVAPFVAAHAGSSVDRAFVDGSLRVGPGVQVLEGTPLGFASLGASTGIGYPISDTGWRPRPAAPDPWRAGARRMPAGGPDALALESLAMPLVDHETFGQPHVVREPRTGLWLMTDEGGLSGKPGIALRWAPTPWRPWGNTTAKNPYTGAQERLVVDQEPALILFEGRRDRAHGNFMHGKLVYDQTESKDRWPDGPPRAQEIGPCLSVGPASPRNQRLYVLEDLGPSAPWPPSSKVTYNDGLSDDPFGDLLGVGFGAYLVAPWFRYWQSEGDHFIDLVYCLSTVNPWQVQLLSTSVRVRSLRLQAIQSDPWVHHERVPR